MKFQKSEKIIGKKKKCYIIFPKIKQDNELKEFEINKEILNPQNMKI